MSTSAWDGEILAADRAAFGGNVRNPDLQKLHQIKAAPHVWAAICGDLAVMNRFVAWLSDTWPSPSDSNPPPEGDYSAIIAYATDDGELFAQEFLRNGNSWGLLPIKGQMAHGSGASFALAAMDCGLCALDAVLVAAKFDPYTSTETDSVHYNERGGFIVR